MQQRSVLLSFSLFLTCVLTSCDIGLTSTTGSVTSPGTSSGTTPGATCMKTDQDQYVYHPDRLQVIQPCLRVSGIVDAIREEADGDKHILLRLDAAYQQLLQPANQNEQGDLVVEPVCVGQVSQSDAVDICASDHDPYAAALPAVGDHVWMEGRYGFDLAHNGWAEIHPLYRSGPA